MKKAEDKAGDEKGQAIQIRNNKNMLQYYTVALFKGG